MERNKANSAAGLWSLLGTYALIAFVALRGSPSLKGYLADFWQFLNGKIPVAESRNLFYALPEILMTIVVSLPVAYIIGIVAIALFSKKDGKHGVTELLTNIKPGMHFAAFLLLVVGEEVTARGIFLGVLPKIHFLSSNTMYYMLMVTGNALWAYWHLSNFEEGNRNIALILPQFIGGFLDAYIFTKYGLAASVLTHFGHNAIVFAVQKLQRVGWVDFLMMGVYGLTTFVSYQLIDKPLTDVLEWVDGDTVFQIAGWNFWDYVCFVIFASSLLSFVFEVLLYDSTTISSKGSSESDLGCVGWSIALGVAFLGLPLFILGLYHVAGWVIEDTFSRILGIAVIMTMMTKTPSVSAGMRQFWNGLPSTYLIIALTAALGFWGTVAYLVISSLISIPTIILKTLND